MSLLERAMSEQQRNIINFFMHCKFFIKMESRAESAVKVEIISFPTVIGQNLADRNDIRLIAIMKNSIITLHLSAALM